MTGDAVAQSARPGRSRGSGFDPLGRFVALAAALERAAAAIARLDARLAGHPLTPAWTWRSRLEAVRCQAAADGSVIDPWHLAAVIEGVRFRLDRAATILDRGAVFTAARHALTLWRWMARPDEPQREAIAGAAATLAAGDGSSPVLAAALGARAWLDQHGGDRTDDALPALRAALARYWQDRGLMPVAAPLLTGARALTGDARRQDEAWVVGFLTAIAEEADAGMVLLRLLERDWFAARTAVRNRRRDSRAAAAIDIMAAAPLVSATSLAASLGIAVKNATALLDGFVARGIAIEVSHRAKRRLFGLKHLAPLRAEARPPGRAGRVRGRTSHVIAVISDTPFADSSDGQPPLRPSLPLSPLAREEFELTGLDDWMRDADQAIRRAQAALERLTRPSDRPVQHRG